MAAATARASAATAARTTTACSTRCTPRPAILPMLTGPAVAEEPSGYTNNDDNTKKPIKLVHNYIFMPTNML